MDILEAVLWLTLNVYHEARSDTKEGQVAVALATANRTERRGLSVREVVLQPYQFSWVGKKCLIPNDTDAFIDSLHSTLLALGSEDFTRGATYYYLDGAPVPDWANQYTFVGKFGAHKFYRDDKQNEIGRGESPQTRGESICRVP